MGSYAIGFFSDHRSQLDSLKAQRLDLQDLAADTDSAISHAEFAAANFDPDLQDYRFAQAKLKRLCIAAQQVRLFARMKLAEELGSVEAANALLHRAGLDDLLDEQHWQAMLLPPAAATAEAAAAPERQQPKLHLEAEPAAEEVPAAMAS